MSLTATKTMATDDKRFLYRQAVRERIPPLRARLLCRWLTALDVTDGAVITLKNLPDLVANGIFIVRAVQKLLDEPLPQVNLIARAPRVIERNIDAALGAIWRAGPDSYFMSSAADLASASGPLRVERALAVVNEMFSVLCARPVRATFETALQTMNETLSSYALRIPNQLFTAAHAGAVGDSSAARAAAPAFWAYFGSGAAQLAVLHAAESRLYGPLYDLPHIKTTEISLRPENVEQAMQTATSYLQYSVDAFIPVFFAPDEFHLLGGYSEQTTITHEALNELRSCSVEFLLLQTQLLMTELSSLPVCRTVATGVWRHSSRPPAPPLVPLTGEPCTITKQPAVPAAPATSPNDEDEDDDEPTATAYVPGVPAPAFGSSAAAKLPEDERTVLQISVPQSFAFIHEAASLPVTVAISPLEICPGSATAVRVAQNAVMTISSAKEGVESKVLFSIPVTSINSVKCTKRSVRLTPYDDYFAAVDNSLSTPRIVLQERDPGLVAWFGSAIATALRRLYAP